MTAPAGPHPDVALSGHDLLRLLEVSAVLVGAVVVAFVAWSIAAQAWRRRR